MAVYKRKKKLKSGKWQTYYFFKFDFDGQTFQGVPPIHTLADAKRAEHEAKTKAMRGLSNKAPTVAEFIRKTYLPHAQSHKKTAWREKDVLDDFVATFPTLRLDECKGSHVREFLAQRGAAPTKHDKERAKTTLNREHSILSAVFSLALAEDWITENPCTRVTRHKAPPSRLLYWTEDEEARVMKYLTNEREHLRALVIVAIGTGMRREEFLSLKAQHCDFENWIVHVYSPKTRTWRYVAMEQAVFTELKALCEGKGPEDFVFINRLTGDRFYDPKKGIKRAAELAKVKCLDWHGLRHTRGTRLAMRGMNAFQIAAELGHSDIRTSQAYVHLAEAGKRAADARTLFEASTIDFDENRWKIVGIEKAG